MSSLSSLHSLDYFNNIFANTLKSLTFHLSQPSEWNPNPRQTQWSIIFTQEASDAGACSARQNALMINFKSRLTSARQPSCVSWAHQGPVFTANISNSYYFSLQYTEEDKTSYLSKKIGRIVWELPQFHMNTEHSTYLHPVLLFW